MEGNIGEALPKCPNYKILLYSHAFSLCFLVDSYPRDSHDPPTPRTRTCAHTHRYRPTGPRGMEGNRGEALPKCLNYKILLYSHTCSLCFHIDPYPRGSHYPPPPCTRTRTHTQTDTDTLYQGKRRGIEGKRF
jgi:hypothetical protein